MALVNTSVAQPSWWALPGQVRPPPHACLPVSRPPGPGPPSGQHAPLKQPHLAASCWLPSAQHAHGAQLPTGTELAAHSPDPAWPPFRPPSRTEIPKRLTPHQAHVRARPVVCISLNSFLQGIVFKMIILKLRTLTTLGNHPTDTSTSPSGTSTLPPNGRPCK